MTLRKFAATAFAFAAVGLVAETDTFAQVGKKKSGDKRVSASLDAAELKYEVDADGDFKLTYELEDDRTQIAFVSSKTVKLGEIEVRTVWSAAMVSEEALDAETANALLIANNEMKIGAWRVEKADDGKHYVIFAAQIDAEAEGDTLDQIIQAVVSTADAKENELTEADEL